MRGVLLASLASASVGRTAIPRAWPLAAFGDCASECGASSSVTRWPPFGSDPLNGWLLTRVEWSRSEEVPSATKWSGQAGGQLARRA